MKKTIILIALFVFNFASAQKGSTIIPAPNFYKVTGDSVAINGPVKIIFEKNVSSASEKKSAQIIEQIFNAKSNKKGKAFKVYISTIDESVTNIEGYKLNVSKDGIRISGKDKGLFYAVQSILQMLPNDGVLKLPSVIIKDEPRYSYRGLHLDVSRHFFSKDVIKEIISQMAFYKLNNFHWHLTDDQGWRIEIKKYPKLTEIGSKRAQTLVGNKFERFPLFFDGNPYGGFYTQEEIKEVVQFATERHVNVIPEIEMPGHASAAVAAYPSLACFPSNDFKVIETWGVFEDVFCAGKEETFEFLEDVLEEVLALFPSTYIHIGGDECPKTRWKVCPNCQKRIKELGLKDEHELQSYFIKRIEKSLNAKGRQIFGWDEILEGGLAPNAAVMSWRGEQGGIAAAKQKHPVIMTPEDYVYFDHNQGFSLNEPLSVGRLTNTKEVYDYNPTPVDSLTVDEQKYIVGVQANLWSEYLTSPAKLNYMLYPRVFALAEIAWTNTENKNYNNFTLQAVPHHLSKLEKNKTLYKVPSPYKSKDTAMVASRFVLDLEPSIKNGKIFYSIDGFNPDQTSVLYKNPVSITIPKGEYRTIKTVQISESGLKSSITKTLVKNSEIMKALKIKPKKQGLKYDYYQAFFNQTNEIDFAKPTRSGIYTDIISINSFKQKEIRYFGLKLNGYIYIPETANYTFSCIADDGAKIIIGDEVIVDNDGRHWINEAFGAAYLEKGYHKISISYFDAAGSAALQCFIKQEGGNKQEISPSDLFYE